MEAIIFWRKDFSFDPATEEKIAEVQSGTTKDIDLAVNAAREALSGEWAKIPSHDRAQILHRLSDEIEANFSVLSELEVLRQWHAFGACSILNRKPWRDSFKILCKLGTKNSWKNNSSLARWCNEW